jgi:hypothetical protein
VLASKAFQHPLAAIVTFVEQLALKSEAEAHSFFSQLGPKVEALPRAVCAYKLLPHLLFTANEYARGSAHANPAVVSLMVPVLLRMAALLPSDEFHARAAPVLVMLFARPDRALRVQLLQGASLFCPIANRGVVEQCFQHCLPGLSDTVAAVRDATVRSLVHFGPCLGEGKLGELFRALGLLQVGEIKHSIRLPGWRPNYSLPCMALYFGRHPDGTIIRYYNPACLTNQPTFLPTHWTVDCPDPRGQRLPRQRPRRHHDGEQVPGA